MLKPGAQEQQAMHQNLLELQSSIDQCLGASNTFILTLEQNFKAHIDSENLDQARQKKLFYLLALFFYEGAADQQNSDGAKQIQQRQLAGILLKNLIQSYYDQLCERFPDEMQSVQAILFAMLVDIGTKAQNAAAVPSSDLQSVALGRKIYVELCLMLSQIVKKQFLADQSDGNNNLLLSLFAAFESGFSISVLDCLT